MKYKVLTLFPEMIEHAFHTSILDRGSKNGAISLETIQIRDFTTDKHNRVDDYTYGGGAGMLMQAEPVYQAWKHASGGDVKKRCIYLTPQGTPFSQKIARDLSFEEEIIFLCGHYEGIDERVLDEIVTDRISIGDYVLTGGELGALVIMDAVSRLVSGVLGNESSADMETFHGDLLEYPQYSRPDIWHEKAVPDVLKSGNKQEIEKWRLEQSIKRTIQWRPDLYEVYRRKNQLLKILHQFKKESIALSEALRFHDGDILYLDDNVLCVSDPITRKGYFFFFEPTYNPSEQEGQKILHFFPKTIVSIEGNRFFEKWTFPFLCEKRFVYTERIPLNLRQAKRDEITMQFPDSKETLLSEIKTINELLQLGKTPYVSFNKDDAQMEQLQLLLGLYPSRELIYRWEIADINEQ